MRRSAPTAWGVSAAVAPTMRSNADRHPAGPGHGVVAVREQQRSCEDGRHDQKQYGKDGRDDRRCRGDPGNRVRLHLGVVVVRFGSW